MFDFKNEIIINKTLKLGLSYCKFLSLIKNFRYIALVFSTTLPISKMEKPTNRDVLKKSFFLSENFISVLSLKLDLTEIDFNDIVQYNRESSLFKNLLEHYKKLICPTDDLCFYICYGKPILNAPLNPCPNSIEIKIKEQNKEVYIGKEFILNEQTTYFYKTPNNILHTFYVDKILSTYKTKTLIYTCDDDYRLNFFLKDYLNELYQSRNRINSGIIRDQLYQGKKICSCLLPKLFYNKDAYELFSITQASESSGERHFTL